MSKAQAWRTNPHGTGWYLDVNDYVVWRTKDQDNSGYRGHYTAEDLGYTDQELKAKKQRLPGGPGQSKAASAGMRKGDSFGWVDDRRDDSGSGETQAITSPAGNIFYMRTRVWSHNSPRYEAMSQVMRETPQGNGSPLNEGQHKYFDNGGKAKDWCFQQMRQFETDVKNGEFDD